MKKILLALILVYAGLYAAESGKNVNGIVTDKATGVPVKDAVVMLIENNRMLAGMITDSTGIFNFENITASKVKLHVRRVGYYEIMAGPFVMPSNDSLSLFIQMEPGAITLDEIVVQAERTKDWLEEKGYYVRKEQGLGKFVNFLEMDMQGYAYATSAMRLVPGLLIDPHAWIPLENRFGMRFASSRARKAPLIMYIDGFEVQDHEWLDKIAASEIAAVEYYPSSAFAPLEYRRTIMNDGVLLIWTKKY